jgi:hypothetical protein
MVHLWMLGHISPSGYDLKSLVTLSLVMGINSLEVGFTPKVNRDIFISFNFFLIWGLKDKNLRNKLTFILFTQN